MEVWLISGVAVNISLILSFLRTHCAKTTLEIQNTTHAAHSQLPHVCICTSEFVTLLTLLVAHQKKKNSPNSIQWRTKEASS